MDTSLSALIRLNQLPTGRRLYAMHRVVEIANQLNSSVIASLAQNAIAADEQTLQLEQRWAQQRKSGKTSALQAKAQKALQLLDNRVDRAISGLRDGAESVIGGAGDDEKELVHEVEVFLNAILPNGVNAVTSKPYEEQSVLVRAIVAKLSGDLAPQVTKFGLSLNAQRLAKLSIEYDEALKGNDVLEFGKVRAARAEGQANVLRVIAKIIGTYDDPAGDEAQKRAKLLAPILKQNQSVSDYIRARRSVPDVDPSTGAETVENSNDDGDGGQAGSSEG